MPSRAGPLEHVDARAVLRLLVEVDRHQAVEVVAEVADDGDRLDEHLRHDDGAAEVQPDAFVPCRATTLHRAAEVDQRRLAQGGARRRAGACGRCRCRARRGSCRGCRRGRRPARGSMSACGQSMSSRYWPSAAAEADARSRAPIAGGDGEGVGRLAGHAELAAGQLRGDVLAGLAGEGQLEIVDRRRAVHGDGLDDAALDPVDQVRSAAGLDDVPAEGGDDGAPSRLQRTMWSRSWRSSTAAELVRQASRSSRRSCVMPEPAGPGRRRRPCSAARRGRRSSGSCQVERLIRLLGSLVLFRGSPQPSTKLTGPIRTIAHQICLSTQTCNPMRTAHSGRPPSSASRSLTKSFCVVTIARVARQRRAPSSAGHPHPRGGRGDDRRTRGKSRTSAPSPSSVRRNASGLPMPQNAPTGLPRSASTSLRPFAVEQFQRRVDRQRNRHLGSDSPDLLRDSTNGRRPRPDRIASAPRRRPAAGFARGSRKPPRGNR